MEKMLCSFERHQKQSREIILLMFFLLNDSPNLDQLKKFSLIKKKIVSIIGWQFYFILDSVCLDFGILEKNNKRATTAKLEKNIIFVKSFFLINRYLVNDYLQNI